MATFSQSTIDKGSDMVQDFLCSTCEDKKLDSMADFYCESCVKFYCENCINMHRKLFTKHAPFGRGDMNKWPVTKKVEEFLLKCDVHKGEHLNKFCSEHSELICANCAFLNHRHCQKVTLISDIVKSQCTDLQHLAVSIQTILKEIKKLQDNKEASIQYVESSYDKQLRKIQETRRDINATLDMIEQKTLTEMKDTLTKLQVSSKSDVDKCIRLRDELKQLQDAIQDISDKSKLELSFIATQKCKDKIEQSTTFLKKNPLQIKGSKTFQLNSKIKQYLSKLSGLGRIKHSTQPSMAQENPNKEPMVELVPNSENTVTKEPVSACAQLRNVVIVKAGEKNRPASEQTSRTVDFAPEFANQLVAEAVNAAGQAFITAKSVFKTWQDKQEANTQEMAMKSDENSKQPPKGWKPAGTQYVAPDESGYIPQKSDWTPRKRDFKPPKSDCKPAKPEYKPPKLECKPPEENQAAAPKNQWTSPTADRPMARLMEMGFFDTALNQRLLVKFDNNIQKVVQELLTLKNKDWSQ